MPPSAHLFRAIPFSGKSVALLLSASMHAAVALAAVRGAPHTSLNASRAEEPTLEVAELELTPAEAPVAEVASQKSALAARAARHHHDYAVPPDHDATAHDPSLKHVLPQPSAPSAQPAVAATAPVVIEAPAPATPRFVMTVGASTRAVVGAGIETGTNDALASSAPAQPIAEASADVPAKLLAGGTPSYTRDAEAAGIEADVPLEIVVDATGSVIGACALTRVGYGLDEAALRSVREYRFSPAQRGGKAQSVRMRWLMRFQLR